MLESMRGHLTEQRRLGPCDAGVIYYQGPTWTRSKRFGGLGTLGSGVARRTLLCSPTLVFLLVCFTSASSPPPWRIARQSAICTVSHLVMSASTALASASKLGDLLAQLQLNPPDYWPEIERTSQSLANDLRSKDGSLHPLCSLVRSIMPTCAL